jgi:flagellin-specific chaperone FliS
MTPAQYNELHRQQDVIDEAAQTKKMQDLLNELEVAADKYKGRDIFSNLVKLSFTDGAIWMKKYLEKKS